MHITLTSMRFKYFAVYAILTPTSHLVQGLLLDFLPSTSDFYSLLVNRSPLIPFKCPKHFETLQTSPLLILSITPALRLTSSILHLSNTHSLTFLTTNFIFKHYFFRTYPLLHVLLQSPFLQKQLLKLLPTIPSTQKVIFSHEFNL